ncbi:MAG: segregation and condensation protein A [Actinomycetes bacterium]
MATPPDEGLGSPGGRSFEVHLENFSGPFDLLLSLISKHKLDITEVALATVTDEFVAHIRSFSDGGWDLGQASEFLLVAATLLDLKAARLLPSGEVDDDEDLALLEARDLLFARLLQYRAYKEVAGSFAERLATEGRRFPRAVPLEPHLANLLPELVMSTTPEQLAAAAARALAPRPEPPGVSLSHLHAPPVSVREQAQVIADRLRRARTSSFRQLVSDAGSTMVVVARFLALLELFRDGAVAFDQAEALAELSVRWTGSESGDVQTGDEFEEVQP